MKKIIVIAGATGDLGGRIVKALLKKNVEVRALVRASTDVDKVRNLEQMGVKVFSIDMSDSKEIAKACEGASCVVSALAGLHDVIITTQKNCWMELLWRTFPILFPQIFP